MQRDSAHRRVENHTMLSEAIPLVVAIGAVALAVGFPALHAAIRCLLCLLGIVAILLTVFRRRHFQRRVSTSITFNLEQYDISERHGFLPAKPLHRLPARFEAWEAIIDSLPLLNRSDGLADCVRSMPAIEIDGSMTPNELRRAYVVLGMMVHSYVNGPSVPWEQLEGGKARKSSAASAPCRTPDGVAIVPSPLAVPWHTVCTRLGLPCVLTACGVDMWNWTVKQPSAAQGSNGKVSSRTTPLLTHMRSKAEKVSRSKSGGESERGRGSGWSVDFEVSDLLSLGPPDRLLTSLTCISTMTGTASEVAFHMMPCAMHAAAAPIWPELLALPDVLLSASSAAGVPGLEQAALEAAVQCCSTMLAQLTTLFNTFYTLFQRVFDGVDIDVFYNVYRPLLGGFWPDGLFLEGVAAAGRSGSGGGMKGPGSIHKGKGPSAGQSTMVVLFDCILGVPHKDGSDAAAFQREMAQYMPEPHRRLVLDYQKRVGKSGSVRDFIAQAAAQAHAGAAGAGSGGGSGLGSVSSLEVPYNDCVKALSRFRSWHLHVASKYLGGKTKYGTGTSTFHDLLQETIAHTNASKVPLTCTGPGGGIGAVNPHATRPRGQLGKGAADVQTGT